MMRETWEKEKNEKVAAIDIDGVLSDYPKCWIDFINEQMATKTDSIKFFSLQEAKEGLSYSGYKKLKALYRTSHYKANLPLIDGAKEFVKALQQGGFKVILLTARPYRQYREIWKDTLDWLEKNDIKPDGIIWNKDKHWAVLQEFPYLRFMVDDNAEIANQVAKLGYKVYLLDNKYNHQPLERNVSRVYKLNEILVNEVFE